MGRSSGGRGAQPQQLRREPGTTMGRTTTRGRPRFVALLLLVMATALVVLALTPGGATGQVLPPITTPRIALPPVTLAPVTVPPVTLPPVTVPAVTLPRVTVPPVTVPLVTAPDVTLPPVT